jgi:hypothetical protein
MKSDDVDIGVCSVLHRGSISRHAGPLILLGAITIIGTSPQLPLDLT